MDADAPIIQHDPAADAASPSGVTVGWWLPALVGCLLIAIVVAAIVARDPTRGVGDAPDAGGQPRLAAATYGDGLQQTVASPVRELVPVLGDRWRRLEDGVGRLAVEPSGQPSEFFAVGLVAYAPEAAVRLQVLTSAGERGITLVERRRHAVVNFGPFRVPNAGAIGLALTGVQPRGPGSGPPVDVSPVEARYLEPGEAIVRQDALRQAGPGGLGGVWVPGGTDAGFRLAPGVRGRVDVVVTGAARSGTIDVEVEMSGARRSATLGEEPATIRVGPFPRPGRVVTLRSPGAPEAQLFIGRILLRPARGA